jgi:N-ethylmaleimide reductase
MSLLYSPVTLGPYTFKNRLVMSPMTRSRALGNVPDDLMVEYYEQRASSAGLIITEGTSPSPNGLGYPRVPGIFSPTQVAVWKKVTDAVHGKGTKIFVQLMHTGRIGHQNNLPQGAIVVGPSAIAAAGEMYTDAEGAKPHPTPKAMTEADIKTAIGEFEHSANNAVAAGFEGIELHGGNGYLLEQFIRPNSNKRTDSYGGSIENRARFVLDVVKATRQGRHPPLAVRRAWRPAALSGNGSRLRLSGAHAQCDGPLLHPSGRSLGDGRARGAAIDQRYLPQGVQRRTHPFRRLRRGARGKRSRSPQS